jgi:hypothetical protein
MHCLMARACRFAVESVTLNPQPQTVVLFNRGPSTFAADYAADPQAAAWEVEDQCAVGLVNGEASSARDIVGMLRWKSVWPTHAKPTWRMIEHNVEAKIAEFLSFRSTQTAVYHMSRHLAGTGHLAGEEL